MHGFERGDESPSGLTNDAVWFVNWLVGATAGVTVVLFLIASVQTGNPKIITSELVLFGCLLLLWLTNRKQPTGNAAFEDHQNEIVQNLNVERRNFIEFLKQEQQAESKAAFAKFMKSK